MIVSLKRSPHPLKCHLLTYFPVRRFENISGRVVKSNVNFDNEDISDYLDLKAPADVGLKGTIVTFTILIFFLKCTSLPQRSLLKRNLESLVCPAVLTSMWMIKNKVKRKCFQN